MPEKWELLDVLIWHDISYDPGRGKYKPLYEWVLRVGYGEVNRPEKGMMDWYIPILKGNSTERLELRHPAMFPRELVKVSEESTDVELWWSLSLVRAQRSQRVWRRGLTQLVMSYHLSTFKT